MPIDIDKGFHKKQERQRNHRTYQEQAEALEKMKKALINGQILKVAAIDAGYGIASGMAFFKKQTGKTMTEFQKEQRQKPQ